MKKLNLAVLAALALLMLASCSEENKGIVIDKAEKLADDAPTASDGYEYLDGVGSWLNGETEYKNSPDENIYSIAGNNISLWNGNLYFQLKKEESKAGAYYTLGHPIYAYISNQTGERHFLCPDPLCTHGAYSGCQYLDLSNLKFSASNPSVMYATRFNLVDGITYAYIYEINNSAATITPIYTPVEKAEELHMVTIELMFEKNDKLYFIYRNQYEYVGKNGETEHDEKSKLMSLDLKTKQTEVINENYPNRAGLVGEVWDKALFADVDTRELYCTDYNFENPVTIMTYEDGYWFRNIYYDQDTEEMYVLVSYTGLYYPKNPDMSGKDIHCKVYKVDKDFNLTEIPMPSEMVTSFQLTRDYIYYTVYDPIQLGSKNGRPLLDTTGGKIYRAPRDNTTEGELFFDNHGEILFSSSSSLGAAYCVVGDNLYLQYYKVRGSGDDMSTYYTGSIARVNVKENTLKWINLY